MVAQRQDTFPFFQSPSDKTTGVPFRYPYFSFSCSQSIDTPSVIPFRKLYLKTLLFLKTKLFRLKPGQSAVLVRGHGYSNSFTLCRGCTLLISQDLNYPPVDTGSPYNQYAGVG